MLTSLIVINGVIKNGEGRTIYLQTFKNDKSVLIDSATIKKNGKFSFNLSVLEKNFFSNLKKFGYSILFENYSEKKKLIKVFQMRFRPERVSGILDLETFNISKTLK